MPPSNLFSKWLPVIVILVLGIFYLFLPHYRYFWDALVDCHFIESEYDHPHTPVSEQLVHEIQS